MSFLQWDRQVMPGWKHRSINLKAFWDIHRNDIKDTAVCCVTIRKRSGIALRARERPLGEPMPVDIRKFDLADF